MSDLVAGAGMLIFVLAPFALPALAPAAVAAQPAISEVPRQEERPGHQASGGAVAWRLMGEARDQSARMWCSPKMKSSTFVTAKARRTWG